MAYESSLNLLDKLPSRASVGYLSDDIAREGQKIRMDDGDGYDIVGEPADKIAFPDYSKVKHLRKYFNRTGYQVFPAWIYNHETGDSRIVRNAAEAEAYGIVFRATTPEERASFGVNYRWDRVTPTDPSIVMGKGEWVTRPPNRKRTVDPDNMIEGGKNFVAKRHIDTGEDHDALIARTVAAVMAAMKTQAPSAPANVDPKQWSEYQEFLAFREAAKAVSDLEPGPLASVSEEAEDDPLIIHDMNSHGDPREKWLAEAERLGVKVDKRWGTDRLIEECRKAS